MSDRNTQGAPLRRNIAAYELIVFSFLEERAAYSMSRETEAAEVEQCGVLEKQRWVKCLHNTIRDHNRKINKYST